MTNTPPPPPTDNRQMPISGKIKKKVQKINGKRMSSDKKKEK
jgi:hypothetical protein